LTVRGEIERRAETGNATANHEEIGLEPQSAILPFD
jgi:hypothetical protein